MYAFSPKSTAKADSFWTAGLLYLSYAAAKVSKLVLVFRFSRALERGDWRKILGTCGIHPIYIYIYIFIYIYIYIYEMSY